MRVSNVVIFTFYVTRASRMAPGPHWCRFEGSPTPRLGNTLTICEMLP